VLGLAPSILLMVTSFTRIAIVLSLLRSALGTQTAPPNGVIVSLAVFLDGLCYVRRPSADAYRTGIEPLSRRPDPAGPPKRSSAAAGRSEVFMLRHVRERDLALVRRPVARESQPARPDEVACMCWSRPS
jgi:flagellar biosynthetic protein FliP